MNLPILDPAASPGIFKFADQSWFDLLPEDAEPTFTVETGVTDGTRASKLHVYHLTHPADGVAFSVTLGEGEVQNTDPVVLFGHLTEDQAFADWAAATRDI